MNGPTQRADEWWRQKAEEAAELGTDDVPMPTANERLSWFSPPEQKPLTPAEQRRRNFSQREHEAERAGWDRCSCCKRPDCVRDEIDKDPKW